MGCPRTARWSWSPRPTTAAPLTAPPRWRRPSAKSGSARSSGRISPTRCSACGNTQWKTYQAFPKLVESTLRQTGAKNLLRARRGRRQRRFRRGRRSAGWVRYGSRWARADAPAAAAPRLKIAFSDAHATRASVLPESAYRLEVIGNDELVGDASRAVGLQQGGAALFHAAHDDPPAQGRNLSCGRSPGGLRPQPAGGRRQHHRASRAQARPGRRAGRQGQPHAASADRQAGHRAPAARRFRRTAGCSDTQRRACVARSHALPRHHQGTDQADCRRRRGKEGVRARHHRQARYRLRSADALPGDRAHARRFAGDDLGHPAALLLDFVFATGRA